jgi:hypothetical protein
VKSKKLLKYNYLELLDNQAISCHISSQKIATAKERNMGYKKVDTTVSFAELSLLRSIESNRSVKMMERIHKAATWENIEALLKEHYHIG